MAIFYIILIPAPAAGLSQETAAGSYRYTDLGLFSRDTLVLPTMTNPFIREILHNKVICVYWFYFVKITLNTHYFEQGAQL
jgi:hypothetical protein